ncbi:hypothetical protein [Pedobacter caeni]|uniref:Uncharacterized protein n=1 Tax=Pedobacter caeni TaxID=288992 RepID=A0A1M5IWZ3_9SPHI|nr:hypothetical protein [Pedobacter caeni]SHG32852.1 hypothetical protein SAMN04488522_105100 [Pedobacter caeni]
MKRIFYILLLFSLYSISANATATLTRSNIEGKSPYTDGTLTVTPGSATNFRVQFSLTRDNSGNFDYYSLQVVHINNATVTVLKDVTNLDYGWGTNSFSIDGIIAVVLPADKQTGEIRVRFNAYNGQQNLGNYINSNYKYTLIGGGVGPVDPVDPIDPVDPGVWTVAEGNFTRNTYDNNKVYIGMNGKYRHIEDANTLYGIFKKNIRIVDSWDGFLAKHGPLGAPIGPNTRLVEDTNTGMVYYQENGVLRYINSPEAANKYSFDLKKAQKIQGTAGYTFGPTFY